MKRTDNRRTARVYVHSTGDSARKLTDTAGLGVQAPGLQGEQQRCAGQHSEEGARPAKA